MAETHPGLLHHFDDAEQQKEASTLGMWTFLVTEILFFGGLFAVYVVYRTRFPEAWAAGSHHLDITLGTVNTAILICSSLTMALAVHSSQIGKNRLLIIFLIILLLFGANRIPEIARSMGKGIRDFKKATREVEEEIKSVGEEPPSKSDQKTS